MKKLLCVFLSILFVLSVMTRFPLPANAAASGTTGDCTWSLDGTVLTISGNGNMGYFSKYSVTNNYYEKRPWGFSVTKVIIQDGVTSVGSYAFYNCPNLTSVIISESVTAIGEYAFSHCPKITSIIVPNKVEKIGDSAFEGCSSIEEITLPFIGNKLNGVENTHFGYIFGADTYESNSVYIPSSLKRVTVTGGNSIEENAFYECNNIEEVIIEDDVRSIYKNAFYSCKNLSNIKLVESVKTIYEDSFLKCDMLTINCVRGSYAEEYANDNGIPCIYITATGTVDGDVNCDGKVDTSDLAVLKLYLAGNY